MISYKVYLIKSLDFSEVLSKSGRKKEEEDERLTGKEGKKRKRETRKADEKSSEE